MSHGFCVHCGNALKAGARFCGSCGKPVEPSESRGVSAQSGPTAPRHIAQRGMPIEERNIIVYTILTLVTCGLWGLVWWFQIGSDLQRATGGDKPNVAIDFLLSIVTCGLWGIVVIIQWPEYINKARQARGMTVVGDAQVMSIVLAIFTGIGHYIYWQSQLNKISRGHE
jgi:hypothetical protein